MHGLICVIRAFFYLQVSTMPTKIVIALDSFKGCLSSQEAGEAAARGVRQACPDCQVRVVPVADGGEGLLEALVSVTGGSLIHCRAHGPLMELRDTCYGLSGDGRTAFIEMARISGLPLVPEELRNPLLTTTYGTGELIADALQRGCRHFLIGLGGSATNDAGLGMLQALGFRFLDGMVQRWDSADKLWPVWRAWILPAYRRNSGRQSSPPPAMSATRCTDRRGRPLSLPRRREPRLR